MPAGKNAGDSPEGEAPRILDTDDEHDITSEPIAPATSAPASMTSGAAAEDAAGAESRTAGGYSYVVVDDDNQPAADASPNPRSRRGWLPWLIAAAIIPAMIVGVAVWFFASGGGGGSTERQNADVTSMLNVFNSQQGVAAKRYEGVLAPGYPGDIPAYPGARLVSSIRQIKGEDAEYYAVYDTTDARRTVAQYFADKFDSDPWQLQGGQTSADSTIDQFSRVDSADLSGIALVAESDKDTVTTILMIVQVAAGAKDAPKDAYSPANVTDELPVGFPDTVPAYPGSNTVQSAYQKKSGTRQFAVSWVTKDDATTALSYYRDAFKNNGWTVQDAAADPTQTAGAAPSGQSIQFTDDKSQISGSVTVGAFEQDDSYTRIDVQLTSPTSGTSGG